MFAFGALAALLTFTSAHAQSAADIEDRIEATFDLVLGNAKELAVPLTRRALARRSLVKRSRIEPLAYSAAESDSDPTAPEQTSVDLVEQGSAEDDIEVARLPRPRPSTTSEATGDAELIGQPLDLVAGAAAYVAEEETAAAPTPASGVEEAAPLVPAAAPDAAPVELVASQACLSVKDVADDDGDFKRNAEVLSAHGLCIAEEKFKERKRPWIIQTVTSSQPGPLWAVMHDDEDLSFDNAVAALKRYGGTLVTVETGGNRNLSGVDPNRNFSADGIGCRKIGDNAAPHYTKFFAGLMDSASAIIALHNNTGKHIPTGGLGHVTMETVPKSMGIYRPDNPKGPLAGTRALVLVTDIAPVSTDTEKAAEALAGRGINAIVEKVKEGSGDCSLSNYAALTGHKPYYNVTVDDDEREKQIGIIDVLVSSREETVASQ